MAAGAAAWLDSRAVDRLIDLDGCVNFRDLGGYPTESGQRLRLRTLFRSDALHALSAADVVRLRDDLALSDIVDLRSNTFFAHVVLQSDEGDAVTVVDARPSDAIALALRARCPIRVAQSVLERASVADENGDPA